MVGYATGESRSSGKIPSVHTRSNGEGEVGRDSACPSTLNDGGTIYRSEFEPGEHTKRRVEGETGDIGPELVGRNNGPL